MGFVPDLIHSFYSRVHSFTCFIHSLISLRSFTHSFHTVLSLIKSRAKRVREREMCEVRQLNKMKQAHEHMSSRTK